MKRILKDGDILYLVIFRYNWETCKESRKEDNYLNLCSDWTYKRAAFWKANHQKSSTCLPLTYENMFCICTTERNFLRNVLLLLLLLLFVCFFYQNLLAHDCNKFTYYFVEYNKQHSFPTIVNECKYLINPYWDPPLRIYYILPAEQAVFKTNTLHPSVGGSLYSSFPFPVNPVHQRK